MDDLEKAILLTYDPTSAPSDPSLRSQALSFLSAVRSQTPPATLLRLSLDLLRRSPSAPLHFWSLQTLADLISQSYASLSPSDDLPLLRSSLLSLSLSPSPSSPPFLKNKLAQTLASLIRIEYPSLFPNPFLDLVPNGSSPSAIDFFSRLLSSLDDDLISQDYPRSLEESAAAMRVKDAMRLQCVPQIVSFFYDSVSLYRASDPNLAAAVLDMMKKYVSWIDINLVANNTFLGLLFDVVEAGGSADQLKSAAGGCLLAIVLKRMDSRLKLALLRTLKPQMGRLFSVPELVVRVGGLITGYAAEALECYKRLGSAGEAMELLEEALPSLFYVVEESDEVDLGNVVGFLADYMSTMKSLPSQKQMVYVGQILELIQSKIRYDPSYRRNLDVPDKIGREEEDLMAEHRKDLFLLFRGVCRVAPEATRVFIRNLIANAMSSFDANVEEVEAVLSLFYHMGETVSEEDMKSGSGLLAELVTMLLSARFSCHSHRVVALVYLETITRYMKFVLENTQYIPNVLAAFLDERGIHHQNPNVGRRASYLFMRAVKLLKAKLVPYIDTILQNLQDTVARYTSLDWSSKELKCSGSEDGSHTFEAIGLMIGMEDVSPEKQSEYLAALLKPLCQQVETLLLEARVQGLEESSAKVLNLQQLIMALNALSKGFSERLVTTSRPAIGIMFKQALDVLLQILVAFPNIKPLRNRVTSFLHCMVEILGVSVFPYLPMALNQLLVESELDQSYNAHDNCRKTDNPTSNISSESIASSLHHTESTIKKSLHSTMSGRGRNEELEEENHRNPFLSTNTFKLSTSKLQFRKELSRALWDEEMEMGEIVEKKGSMWATTGIIRNGKLYCRIEEILFMAERGALLLSDSDDTILSIKDIYKKIANLKYGCSWDSFEAYRHLKSLGYIVGWYGIPWTVKSSVGCGSSDPRQSTPDGNGRFCQQVENKLSNLFKDMQLDELKPTFSVYLPNSKFRKSTPGDPSFLLCVLRGNPPSRVEVESMEEKCDGIPLKFCFVDHGRISFFSYDKISLPILP